jgi:hypothetical protein
MTTATTLPPGYEDALRREVEHNPLRSPARGRARSITNDSWQPKDKRTEDEKLMDKMIVSQGMALERTAWDSIDEVKRHVLAAYGHGSKPLNASQIAAVVAIAWTMQLDPHPGSGHLQVWEQGGRLRIEPGYQGYIFKAKQQKQMFYNSPRPMTREERELRGLKDNEIGAVCELYEMEACRFQKELGLPISPIIGTAVWRPGMNVANARDPFWMASKNAVKDAIRQLGLGFSRQTPEIEGFHYDRENDSWEENQPSQPVITVNNPAPAPAAPAANFDIEGEIIAAAKASAEKAQTVAETPEAPAVKSEPETAPASAEAPASPVTDAPAPVVFVAYERPSLSPSDLKTQFNTWRNAALEQNKSNPHDRDDIGKDGATALLSQFEDIADKPTARMFVTHITGRDLVERVKVFEQRILQDKILNAPDRAKVEIENYCRVHKLETPKPAPAAASATAGGGA